MPRSEVYNAFNGKRGAPQRRSAAAQALPPQPQHATPTPPPPPYLTRIHPPPRADDGLAFARHWLRSNGSVVLDYEGRLFLSLWRLRAGSVALG